MVPSLRDRMPVDLRWSWCNNNRNKVHNRCNVLESSKNHPLPQSVGKLSSIKPVPGAKKAGDSCTRGTLLWLSPTKRKVTTCHLVWKWQWLHVYFLQKGWKKNYLHRFQSRERGGTVVTTSPHIPKHPPMCHLGFMCPGVFPREYEPQILVGTILQSW